MKVELPDPAGGNVISIEVARKHRFERKCPHYHVTVDPDYASIECKDCERQLNPVEWIAMMTEEWERVTDLYRKYAAAKELYDEKQKTQCQHCKRITRINTPNDFSKRMRERGLMV